MFLSQQIHIQDLTFKNGNLYRKEQIAVGIKGVDKLFSLEVSAFKNDMLIPKIPRQNRETDFFYSVNGCLNRSLESVECHKDV